MATWQQGRTYDYYGHPITCLRRWFDGPLEMVDLAFVFVVKATTAPEPFTRTARTLAPCVVPRVTETLGGVERPETCHHDWYPRVRADAGPNTGKACCEGCGATPELAPAPEAT